MKNLYIITFLDLSLNTAARKRIISYSKALDEQGINVRLVSYYNNLFFPSDFEKVEKIKSRKKDISSIVDFLKKLKKLISEQEGESRILLYPTSFSPFDILFILFFKFTSTIKFFVEINEVRRYNTRLPTKFPIRNFRRNLRSYSLYTIYYFTDFLYKLAYGHIYISHPIAKYYDKKRSLVVPILCSSRMERTSFFQPYIQKEIFRLGFAGTIDIQKEKLHTFFRAIQELKKRSYRLEINLYGPIVGEKEFYNILDSYAIKILFQYHGIVEQTKLLNRLKKDNHLLILPRGKTKQNFYGFSTKLSDYLETEIPIITSTVGDIDLYFRDKENSFTYIPDNEKSLTNKLEFIIENYNTVSPKVIKGGKKLINEEFHYSVHSQQLAQLIFI